jgi:hypothetical protein
MLEYNINRVVYLYLRVIKSIRFTNQWWLFFNAYQGRILLAQGSAIQNMFLKSMLSLCLCM